MIDEYDLFEHGYTAILTELERDDVSFNIDVLAQACARKARTQLSSREESLGWATAAVTCYAKAAQRRTPGFSRQGSEVPGFGLMSLMILRWGPEIGSRVLDSERIMRWIQDGIDEQETPGRFRDALAGVADAIQWEHAFCLRERLEVGLPLFEKGLLPSSLALWLESAGLLKESS